ncbi:PREDICTED: sex comb on midleg-like protein 1 [Ceratotherium simum simum]|uniref:Sex comb on midleg-like protein 1 n=1 Tax=Ceratotherium simum simum TaxID=73337 RepID=A0ABM1D485_CERSS|nr:PREDICTED: sex comb on midleg-like protein 1 [Ceratotherium simum simum]XP_014646617.1 PREDICTED: sex comb on midleg-like protein 1 [Ceratotherium simum simum]
MSSGSSEIDVIRTRIPVHDEDDDTILYAFEPNPARVKTQESVLSDTPYNEEQDKTILDVFNHCQAINDAIQNLDKKVDVINGKVSKIRRFRVKPLRKNHKFGYSYKKYYYLLSRKVKLQKMKKKELPSSFSYPESYSPTIPVRRPEIDYDSNFVGSPYQSQESPEHELQSFPAELEPELEQELEPSLSQNLSPPSLFSSHSYPSYFTPDEPVQGTPTVTCFGSPEAHSTRSVASSPQASSPGSAAMLAQDEPSPVHNPEMMAYPTSLENKSFDLTASSRCMPAGIATSSPVRADPGMLKHGFSDDPLTWSVDEVILFLKHIDPQISCSLADTFRQHDIDGKALLLLKGDIMMKYMGLKLGTTVKLCHYIERLKEKSASTIEKMFAWI